MPIMRMTKNAKRDGMQTYAFAHKLPSPLQEVELEYLDVRDMYVNEVARREQFEEALVQAKRECNEQDIRTFSNKIHAISAKLEDVRARVRSAGERSWCEAFHIAACSMVPADVRKKIEAEADKLLGRGRSEYKK
ncbi:MAG: hypothetical protein AAF416_15605 [Pseudomonadota bacterium]